MYKYIYEISIRCLCNIFELYVDTWLTDGQDVKNGVPNEGFPS